MGEPFRAIGFRVEDKASYEALAEEAHQRGALSLIRRKQGIIHGCCWSLGAGLEVWTMLYESEEGLYYADCRPAFRGQQIFNFYPWEIIEYEEDGEALARGAIPDTGYELVFALQNLTEIDPRGLGNQPITAAVSGLAYQARVTLTAASPRLTQVLKRNSRRKAAENDYFMCGKIISWREIKNLHTASEIFLVTVDFDGVRLEVLINRASLKGELKRGAWLSGEIWLQGHILNERELESRYEGIDREIPARLYWKRFQRQN